MVISDESQNSPNPLSPIRSCRQTDLCPCSLSCSSPLVENRSTHPHPRGTKLVRKKGGGNGGEEEEGRCQEEEVQFRRVCPHRGRHLRLRDPAGACPTTQHNAFRFLHPLSTDEPEWERASLPPHSGVLSIHIQPTRFTQGVIANESLRMSLHPSCVGEVHNPTT